MNEYQRFINAQEALLLVHFQTPDRNNVFNWIRPNEDGAELFSMIAGTPTLTKLFI